MLSILGNTCCWPVRLLCRVLDVHPSGFYAWLQQPHSQRHQADLRLTGQIKQFWLESGCVYGYRKIHLDLRRIQYHPAAYPGESDRRIRHFHHPHPVRLRDPSVWRIRSGTSPASITGKILQRDHRAALFSRLGAVSTLRYNNLRAPAELGPGRSPHSVGGMSHSDKGGRPACGS